MHSLVIGATQGLGYALAERSLGHGITPIVTGQTTNKARTMDLGGLAVRREALQVEDDANVEALMERLLTDQFLDIGYLFYLPATHLKGHFIDQKARDVDRLIDVTIKGLLSVVRHFDRVAKLPYHLIVVASTTSWKIRPDEAVYGMAKAAQAQFARNFHQERAKQRPGSKTLIVHPGGMRTHFLDASGIDSTGFLDPAIVAARIWDEIQGQEAHIYPALHELHILRSSNGSPVLERGTKAPQ